jgi:phosphoglycolate phosphatase-like HAD superfamily hydrolase
MSSAPDRSADALPRRLRDFAPRPEISHVVFDFDGTLSWLRHGWPDIMVNLFLEFFPFGPGDDPVAVRERLLGEILSLNGQPTLQQMRLFSSQMSALGARVPRPEELLVEYQWRLDEVIEERSQRVVDGLAFPDHFVVFGARALLRQLADRGLALTILSGTVEDRVREEAALLQLAPFFEGRIYGSPADSTGFTKRMVLERILADHGLVGGQLLSFGDGPVEVHHAADLGGLSVAVASDEEVNGSGVPDPRKARQLAEAGAHLLVADYRDPGELLDLLLGPGRLR